MRSTYPQRVDDLQLMKDINRYGISERLAGGKNKNIKRIRNEISAAKLKEGDIQIENDRKLAQISEVFKTDSTKATKQLGELIPKAIGRMPTGLQKKAESDRLPQRFKYGLKKEAVTREVD